MDLKNPAIQYFVDYWEDLWSGVSSRRDLLTVFNPRVVIKELVDEITINKERNKANEEFFRRALGGYLKRDPGSQCRLKLNLQMILKEFDTLAHRPVYLQELCRSTLKECEALEYFEDSLGALVTEVQTDKLDDERKIRIQTIVNHLIVEFRELGHVDEEIRKMPRGLFSSVQKHNDIAYWTYPHSIEYPERKDPSALEEYERQLRTYEASLTEVDRVRDLLKLAKAKKERYTYIFRIYGMQGTEELQVADVALYPPTKKRLMGGNASDFSEDELLGSSQTDRAINASVEIEAVNVAAGEPAARAKVEKAMAFCRLVMRGETTLRLSASFIALRAEGRVAASSHHAFENRDDDVTKRFTLDAEQKRSAENGLKVVEQTRGVAETNGWGARFEQACYWLRRADESTSDVDKLLAYWICIESLCTKSGESRSNWFHTKAGEQETDIFLVKQIVGKMRAIAKCFEHGWSVYYELANPIQLKLLGIPADVVKDAHLAPLKGQSIQLADFVSNVGRIEAILPDSLLKDQVVALRRFYSDKDVALSVLQKHLRTAQDELAYIYRTRNKIAHDGRGDDPMLPFLARLAGSYAVTLFNRIAFYVTKRDGRALLTILIAGVQEYERIEARLKVEGPVSVFLEGQG